MPEHCETCSNNIEDTVAIRIERGAPIGLCESCLTIYMQAFNSLPSTSSNSIRAFITVQIAKQKLPEDVQPKMFDYIKLLESNNNLAIEKSNSAINSGMNLEQMLRQI